MSPDDIGELANGAIPFFGGIYTTLLGFRVIGKMPGESLQYDQWLAGHERRFKLQGPLLMVFGIFLAVRGIALRS